MLIRRGRTKCGAENHYACMSMDELKNFPIEKIADDNCVLFMWVTFPLLQEGLDLIKAWGFKYKTLGFSWIKTNTNGKPWHGVGAYAKSNCEYCLMAVKGRVGRKGGYGLTVISNYVSSVVISKRSRHSEKPAAVRDKIVELFGDIPRIELFAREKPSGWDVFGNEVEGVEL